MKQKTYIAIDLKSFYASVECRERGLDSQLLKNGCLLLFFCLSKRLMGYRLFLL